jgi:hypothetical protein
MSAAVDGLPVVRMCDNPECGGWNACDRIRVTRRTMASLNLVPAGADEWLVRRITLQSLAADCVSDTEGIRHAVPGNCEFTVHMGHGGLPADQHYRVPGGFEACTAVYSGPDADLDDVLAGSPEWSPELMNQRLLTWPALAA